jgi:hypothetical protein
METNVELTLWLPRTDKVQASCSDSNKAAEGVRGISAGLCRTCRGAYLERSTAIP